MNGRLVQHSGRAATWQLRGGPKTNGRWTYMEKGRLRVGGRHRPMTRAARRAFFARSMETERRLGWVGFIPLSRRYTNVDTMFHHMGIE